MKLSPVRLAPLPQLSARSRLTIPLVALGILAALLPRHKTQAATLATVTVGSASGGVMQTQLSTNNVWSGMLDQAPGAPTEFNALHDPLVRIHVGDDGGNQAMPEINKGKWANPGNSFFVAESRPFENLDALVTDSFKSGQAPLMNIKFAPDWMWSCYPKSLGVNNKQGAGSIDDTTFAPFAQYMARLVSYYNKGSMTTEAGTVITNPYGTSHRITYWELWNEPDLNIETPCAPPNGLGITPAQYVTMWNAVTAAMLAVDPTLQFVGPATSGGQFGSTSYNDYVTDLMSGATVAPAAISFHGYGYWSNSVTDQTIFDGDSTGAGGITNITQDVQTIHGLYPHLPIWLTEVNVNADWGNDPYSRPWSAFSAAWWGALFAQLAPLGVAMIHQFDVVDGPQFGLLDQNTGVPYLPYWEQMALDHAFPAGSTLLTATSSDSHIPVLAAKKPDGTISVLVADRDQNSASCSGCTGVGRTVTVNLSGITPTAITDTQIDATTSPNAGPSTVTVPVSTSPTVTFGGYGLSLLSITTGGTPPPTSTPTSTPRPTATPTGTLPATPTPTKIPTATPTKTPAPTPTKTPAPTSTPTSAPTSTPTSTAGLTLYYNAVSPDWTDNSFNYSAINPQDPSTYVSPPYSYEITCQSYGALELIKKDGSILPSAYPTLTYDLNTGGQPINDFGVVLSTPSGDWINEIVLTSGMTTPLPNGWVKVTLLLAQDDPHNTPIGVFDFGNATPQTLGPARYDNIQLS
jgi:hypothetical protein